MFVLDVIGGTAIGSPVRPFDLQVGGPVLRFGLVGVPAEPSPGVRLPPLYPVVGATISEGELDPKPCLGLGVSPFEERDGIDPTDDFVGS